MEKERRALLEEVMRRLAEGELAMVWVLVTEFGPELERAVRGHLRAIHRYEVAGEPGRLEGLVTAVALWFHDHGSAYDPTGALPWVWARKAIRALVSDEVGHRCDDIDSAEVRAELEAAAPSLDPSAIELRDLAEREPTVALLIEAAEEVGSERDAKVHLEYRVQWALGDPSPSHTVAELSGLAAANVRQIDTRMRKKVARLVSVEERYEPLKELAWLN